MTILTALAVLLAWLLCGFVGSTAMFYSPWTDGLFHNTRRVTVCQAFCRSLWGPLQILSLVLSAACALFEVLFRAVRGSKGCTKIIFDRNPK